MGYGVGGCDGRGVGRAYLPVYPFGCELRDEWFDEGAKHVISEDVIPIQSVSTRPITLTNRDLRVDESVSHVPSITICPNHIGVSPG